MRRDQLRDWLQTTHVSAPARLVFIALDAHANGRRAAWPSIPRLAYETATSEATVRRALRELETCGLVEREHRAGASTRYQLIHNPDHSDTPVTVTPLSQRPAPLSESARTPVRERAREGIQEGLQKDRDAATFSGGAGWLAFHDHATNGDAADPERNRAGLDAARQTARSARKRSTTKENQ